MSTNGSSSGNGDVLMQLLRVAAATQSMPAVNDPDIYFELGKFNSNGTKVEKRLSRGWRRWGGIFTDAKPMGMRVRAAILNFYMPSLPVSILMDAKRPQ